MRIETVGVNGRRHALVDAFESPRMVAAGPTWSPESTRLAYARDDLEVVVTGVTDHERRTMSGESVADFDPRWAPAGESILFMRETGGGFFDLVAGRTDGRQPRTIARRLVDAEAEWSPDGRQVAFAGVTFAGDRMYYLYVVDAHNPASPEKLSGPVETVRPTWSPDGDEIAFATVDGIKAVRKAGGSERTVIEVDPEAVRIGEVSWSPDGRSIAFVTAEQRKGD